jgi:hypothetical protein
MKNGDLKQFSDTLLASFRLETSGPGSHARLPAAWESPLLDFPDKNQLQPFPSDHIFTHYDRPRTKK